jgi:chorismate-pyruvate lyase
VPFSVKWLFVSANISTGFLRPGHSMPDSPPAPISWITADDFFKNVALVQMDPILRILLISDGSTTALLQALWLSPIQVEVVCQKELPLDSPTAEFLKVEPGSIALAREAWLRANGRRLVYASSMILLKGLSRPLLQGVSGRQKPLGLLFNEAGQPVVRDRLEIAFVTDSSVQKAPAPNDGKPPFWLRRYRLSLGTQPGLKPIALIQERFTNNSIHP